MQISIAVYCKEQKPRAIKYKTFSKKIITFRIMSGQLIVRRKGKNVTNNDRSYKLLE
jgi:hypothetical protein